MFTAAFYMIHSAPSSSADSLDVVLSEIKEGLLDIEKQPENTEKYSGLDKSPAQFGVAKRLRDNDVDLHSNQ